MCCKNSTSGWRNQTFPKMGLSHFLVTYTANRILLPTPSPRSPNRGSFLKVHPSAACSNMYAIQTSQTDVLLSCTLIATEVISFYPSFLIARKPSERKRKIQFPTAFSFFVLPPFTYHHSEVHSFQSQKLNSSSLKTGKSCWEREEKQTHMFWQKRALLFPRYTHVDLCCVNTKTRYRMQQPEYSVRLLNLETVNLWRIEVWSKRWHCENWCWDVLLCREEPTQYNRGAGCEALLCRVQPCAESPPVPPQSPAPAPVVLWNAEIKSPGEIFPHS